MSKTPEDPRSSNGELHNESDKALALDRIKLILEMADEDLKELQKEGLNDETKVPGDEINTIGARTLRAENEYDRNMERNIKELEEIGREFGLEKNENEPLEQYAERLRTRIEE